MGTLQQKWGPNGDPKTEKGPHGDRVPQMGTHVGTVFRTKSLSDQLLTEYNSGQLFTAQLLTGQDLLGPFTIQAK